MTVDIVAADDELAVVGAGGTSCGRFIAQHRIRTHRDVYFTWTQGYLSGLNANHGEADSTDLSDYEAHKLWIKNYCEENPLDLYAIAALNLWHELRDRQGLEPDLLFQLKDQP